MRRIMNPAIESALPKIRQRIHATLNDHHVPGVAVAIVSDQDLAWAEGFGLADIAAKRAMTPETLFGVASISKTFTGAAIVQLRDEGKLSLDDPLVKFIPEFAGGDLSLRPHRGCDSAPPPHASVGISR